MTLTISVIVMLVTYICGAITKIFIEEIPNRYIPIQNVIIGIISGVICFFIEIDDNIIESILICLMSALSAGGISDLVETNKKANIDDIS
ncbi:MAG TPA: hypothetical protein IAB65_05840 [Candidatus Onthocola stercorigallinarum]|nr:hypothetical protein [Candidatus Onthocola stercorigallinarum]